MTPETMQAWVVDTPGPIDGKPLRRTERPVPQPAPGEVRIRVRVVRGLSHGSPSGRR